MSAWGVLLAGGALLAPPAPATPAGQDAWAVTPTVIPCLSTYRGWQTVELAFANSADRPRRLEFSLETFLSPEDSFRLSDVVELAPGARSRRAYPVVVQEHDVRWTAVDSSGHTLHGSIGNGYAAVARAGLRSRESWLVVVSDERLQRQFQDFARRHRLLAPACVRGDAVPAAEGSSGFRIVVADVQRSGLDGKARHELLACARLGATLLLLHAGEDVLPAQWPEAARLLAGQRTIRLPGLPEATAARTGHGRVLALDARGGVPWDSLLRAFEGPNLEIGWMPWWDALPLLPQFSGVHRAPHALAFVLLLLATAWVGPWTFARARRSGRPAAILWRTPAAALCSCALFGLAAAYVFGIDVRRDSWSLTVLDEGAATATTLEVRALHAPRSGSLRPAPGAFVMHEFRHVSARARHGEPRALAADASHGLELHGAFLPGRRVVRQFAGWDRPTRARLALRREGEHLVVENALGADLLALVVPGPAGEAWRLESPLPRGATARLRRMPAADAEALRVLLAPLPAATVAAPPAFEPFAELRDGLSRSGVTFVPGTFLARAAGPSFCDDGGLDMSEESGCHLVYGVLEAPPAGVAMDQETEARG